MDTTLEFHDEVGSFAVAATGFLGGNPVLSTVVSTVVELERDGAGRARATREGWPYWLLVVRDGRGEVVGAGMRTAPFASHPAYLLSMPESSARQLARVLAGRGEYLDAVNGALPAARVVAEETARLTGREARVTVHTRLFELRELVEPRRTAGRARPATTGDLELVHAWFEAFRRDADAQAGRVSAPARAERVTRDDVVARVESGRVLLWEDDPGFPVHLTAYNPPAFGVVRVGPVYTSSEHRGRGYASAAVAEVSRRILAAGHRPCLFTDQANPVSNKVYEALGYEPLVDMADLELH